jgi:hypothetical protein
LVADSVSDIARAESTGVSSGEGQEARESETTDNGDSLRSVTLHTPLLRGADGVEEVMNEDISLAVLHINLLLV